MIYSVTGVLRDVEPGLAVVECAGVGYACKTTNSTLAALPRAGGKVTLYTHLNVSESDISLFGFATKAELTCFRLVTTVSGVGPKAGLALLSELSPDKLAFAVAADDYKALTRCPGIGNKIAQRIVLELKDKLGAEGVAAGAAELSGVDGAAGSLGEAMGALLALGYSRGEAATALGRLDASLPVEELVKGALKGLASGR